VDAGEFRLLDSKSSRLLKTLTGAHALLAGLTVWRVPADQPAQSNGPPGLQGSTNYNFRRSFLVAIDGMLSSSTCRYVTLRRCSPIVLLGR